MSAVYFLTLRQLSGRWRITIMAALAMLPVLTSVITLRSDRAPSVADFELVVFSSLLAGSIIPMVVLAIAAAAFANEIEDRTIANLTLTPLSRWQIVLPKLLGTMTVATPFVLVSAFLTSHVAFLGDMRASLAAVAAALAGVLLYSSAFMWLGLVTTQAIGIGLLYIVVWEGFFSGFVSGVRLLSIRHYTNAFMHGLDERRFANANHLSLTAVSVVAVILFAAFVFFSVKRLRRMDIP